MDRLRKINHFVLRVTWVLLTIGLIDHFLFTFLPRDVAEFNILLLWVLVVLVFAGEVTTYTARKRANRAARIAAEAGTQDESAET